MLCWKFIIFWNRVGTWHLTTQILILQRTVYSVLFHTVSEPYANVTKIWMLLENWKFQLALKGNCSENVNPNFVRVSTCSVLKLDYEITSLMACNAVLQVNFLELKELHFTLKKDHCSLYLISVQTPQTALDYLTWNKEKICFWIREEVQFFPFLFS
jgi:hypothetical protein